MAKKKGNENKSSKSTNENVGRVNLLFGKENYTLMGIGFAIVVVGFCLIYGTEGDIYDFRRTTLAPITVIAGFVVTGISIFKSSKKENESD